MVAQPFSRVVCVSRLLRQDGVCLARVHDLHQPSWPTVRAEGDRECSSLLQLPCS